MKTIVALFSVLVFCTTFFGGIYFFHQDIVANVSNTLIFCGANGTIAVLMFFALKRTTK